LRKGDHRQERNDRLPKLKRDTNEFFYFYFDFAENVLGKYIGEQGSRSDEGARSRQYGKSRR